MLTRAKIQNFQSIKELDINLNSPIVMFTGATDSGKSAILRAIKNAIFDGTGGNYYRIEKGKKKQSMAIAIESDKGSIEWQKSKNNATYIINGIERPDCGKIVPKEVSEALGLTSEQDLEENLHYRNQFQSAFLLIDRGPKESYRLVSRIMGADIVIQILEVLEKEVRLMSQEEKAILKRIDDAIEDLNKYYSVGQISKMKSDIENMKIIDQMIIRNETKISTAQNISKNYQKVALLNQTIETTSKLLAYKQTCIERMTTAEKELYAILEQKKLAVTLSIKQTTLNKKQENLQTIKVMDKETFTECATQATQAIQAIEMLEIRKQNLTNLRNMQKKIETIQTKQIIIPNLEPMQKAKDAINEIQSKLSELRRMQIKAEKEATLTYELRTRYNLDTLQATITESRNKIVETGCKIKDNTCIFLQAYLKEAGNV